MVHDRYLLNCYRLYHRKLLAPVYILECNTNTAIQYCVIPTLYRAMYQRLISCEITKYASWKTIACLCVLSSTLNVTILWTFLKEYKGVTDQIFPNAIVTAQPRWSRFIGLESVAKVNPSSTFRDYDAVGVYTYHNVCIEAPNNPETSPRVTVYGFYKNDNVMLPAYSSVSTNPGGNTQWPIHYSILIIPKGYRIISDHAAFFTQHAGLDNLYHLFMDLFRLQLPVLVSTNALDNPTANRFIYRYVNIDGNGRPQHWFYKWGFVCQKLASMAGTRDYNEQILGDVTTSPCLSYLLLAHQKQVSRRWQVITSHRYCGM